MLQRRQGCGQAAWPHPQAERQAAAGRAPPDSGARLIKGSRFRCRSSPPSCTPGPAGGGCPGCSASSGGGLPCAASAAAAAACAYERHVPLCSQAKPRAAPLALRRRGVSRAGERSGEGPALAPPSYTSSRRPEALRRLRSCMSSDRRCSRAGAAAGGTSRYRPSASQKARCLSSSSSWERRMAPSRRPSPVLASRAVCTGKLLWVVPASRAQTSVTRHTALRPATGVAITCTAAWCCSGQGGSSARKCRPSLLQGTRGGAQGGSLH